MTRNNDNVCNILYLKEGIKHEKATPHVIEPMSQQKGGGNFLLKKTQCQTLKYYGSATEMNQLHTFMYFGEKQKPSVNGMPEINLDCPTGDKTVQSSQQGLTVTVQLQ